MFKLGKTHGGFTAHSDEFITTCVLLYYIFSNFNKYLPIVRGIPTTEEMTDPDIIIWDIGGVYDANSWRFDHHMKEFTGQCVSSLSLVLDKIDTEKMFKPTRFDWLETLCNIDNNGPFQTAKDLGCDSKIIFKLQSPVTGYALSRFAESTIFTNTKNSEFYFTMMDIGKYLWTTARDLETRCQYFLHNSTINSLPSTNLKYITHNGTEHPSFGMDIYLRESMGEPHSVACSVTKDDRGPGLTLYRFNDNPQVDFSRITSRDLVSFIHESTGFICKTKGGWLADRKSIDLNLAEKLIKEAYIKR
jgi:hypothetical protein